MEIEIVINRSGTYEELRARIGSGGVQRALGDLLDESARIGRQSAEIYAPERSRRLKRKLVSTPANREPTGALEARVGVGEVHDFPGRGAAGPPSEGAELYPLYVHEGTGLFGAYHRLIRPRRAKLMMFPGRTGLIRAKTTQGQRPQPYLAEAFEDVTAYIRGRIDSTIDEIIGRP
jgi:hypothetical protein